MKTALLCDYITEWTGSKLNAVAMRRLILRLDENNSGHVTLSTLQGLVKRRKMKDVIQFYTAGISILSSDSTINLADFNMFSDPAVPLLVWIDDDVVGNTWKVNKARERGVTVVQLPSTSAAKAWITVNRGRWEFSACFQPINENLNRIPSEARPFW